MDPGFPDEVPKRFNLEIEIEATMVRSSLWIPTDRSEKLRSEFAELFFEPSGYPLLRVGIHSIQPSEQ